MSVDIVGDDVVVRVFDTGAWRPRMRLVTACAKRELEGLALIHALARRVENVRDADGTALVMTLDRVGTGSRAVS